MKTKRISAALIAAMMTLTLVIPVFALGKTSVRYPTPEGYNDHEYQKLVTFLEIEDEDGVKNGEKLCEALGTEYDPEDPAAWGYAEYHSDGGGWYSYHGFVWNDEPDARVYRVYVGSMGFCGTLDLSGFEAIEIMDCSNNDIVCLDVSGCVNVESIWCECAALSEIRLDGCDILFELLVGSCLTELDISGCPSLGELYCSDNLLTELDVSHNPYLYLIVCEHNMFKLLDFAGSAMHYFDSIAAVGNGYISTRMGLAIAEPMDGAEFLGWYNREGEFLSDNIELYNPHDEYGRDVIARFTGWDEYEQGDANGDGNVDSQDALIVLRFSLGLVDLDPDAAANCDMNGDGSTDTQDALIILRIALGIG